jgi:hypothetical protein
MEASGYIFNNCLEMLNVDTTYVGHSVLWEEFFLFTSVVLTAYKAYLGRTEVEFHGPT